MPAKARNSCQSSKCDKLAYFVTIKNIVTKTFNCDVLYSCSICLFSQDMFSTFETRFWQSLFAQQPYKIWFSQVSRKSYRVSFLTGTPLKVVSVRLQKGWFFLTGTPLKVSDYIVNPIKKVSEFTYQKKTCDFWGVPVIKKNTLYDCPAAVSRWKLFQTERTQWSACLPSFCELVLTGTPLKITSFFR